MIDIKNSTRMNSVNQSKLLGVIISAVVFGSVTYTTVIGDKKTTQPDQMLPVYSDALPQNSAPSQPAPIKATTPIMKTYNRDDEGEGEDDEGGNLPAQQLPPPVVTTKPTMPMGNSMMSAYKNGTYSAVGSYMSPGGYDEIGITLTLSGDIVTSVSATNMAGDGTSSRYMDRFISGFQPYVVGQNIASIYLTKVSGASLTPRGFNDALNKIKTQAKA